MTLQYDKNGGLLRAFSFARLIRGFAKLKKIKKSEKMLKWVGGSSPNSDFYFFRNFVFVVLFSCFR